MTTCSAVCLAGERGGGGFGPTDSGFSEKLCSGSLAAFQACVAEPTVLILSCQVVVLPYAHVKLLG